jgi:ArsR family transcriptional regulator
LAKEMGEFISIDYRKVDRIRRALPDLDSGRRMAGLFKTLSDPTRLRIVSALELEELCVCDIAALASLTQPLVSHHLQVLRQLRIVKYRRVGKMAFYGVFYVDIKCILVISSENV